ncbi:MAG: hypothetical protein QNI84_15805 [Henriciella sp.]|nr:hypothetical protein [Henriciella sp.]
MKREIKKLQPFPFESDFSAPQPEVPDLVSMSAAELRALLAETRDGAVRILQDETLSAESERLQQVSEDLKQALATIVELATLLETAALSSEEKTIALSKVRRLAATLIDGQGELFANSTPHSPLGNHSD